MQFSISALAQAVHMCIPFANYGEYSHLHDIHTDYRNNRGLKKPNMQHLPRLQRVQPETAARNTRLERQLKTRPTDMKNIVLERHAEPGRILSLNENNTAASVNAAGRKETFPVTNDSGSSARTLQVGCL